MHIQRALAPSSLAAFIVCAAMVPAAAQPTASPGGAMAPATHAVVHASQLIQVNACHAALNISQSGGWAGYSPGWYGGRWADPWGGYWAQPSYTTTDPQLGVDYMNISPKVMTEIQFGLIANGILKAEARDVGKFTPNAEIKHKFNIPASTFPIGTGLPQCVPLHIVFEDGTKWRNPNLPPKNQHIYLNP